MNFKNLTIKTLCKRALIDLGSHVTRCDDAQILEGYIDVIREARGLNTFALTFAGALCSFELQVRFYTEMRQDTISAASAGGLFSYGLTLRSSEPEVVKLQWLQEVIHEIHCLYMEAL